MSFPDLNKHLISRERAFSFWLIFVFVFFFTACLVPPPKIAGLRACKAEVVELCATHNCNPILVRLAWHDAGKRDRTRNEKRRA